MLHPLRASAQLLFPGSYELCKLPCKVMAHGVLRGGEGRLVGGTAELLKAQKVYLQKVSGSVYIRQTQKRGTDTHVHTHSGTRGYANTNACLHTDCDHIVYRVAEGYGQERGRGIRELFHSLQGIV